MGTLPEAGAAPSAGGQAAARAGGAPWVLLPLVWCVWLLVWLAPSLLVAPYLSIPREWLAADSAPAAVVAAAALFLVAIWPFWPALAGHPPGGRITGRWLGRTVLEAAILAALAAPFVLVAWSVGGRTMQFGPLAAAAGGLIVLGLSVRLAAAGIGPGGTRWLMLVAALACSGPVLLAYAGTETMQLPLERVLAASPVVGAVRLAVHGWTEPTWPQAAGVVLGGMLVFVLLGLSFRRRGASRA